MDKNLFRAYLARCGYSKNVVINYSNAVDRIARGEGLTWGELAKNISKILPLYEAGGAKEAIGKEGRNTNINALRRFEEFVRKSAAVTSIRPIKGHFYGFPDGMPVDFDDSLFSDLESEYECIMGFGRDEFFKKFCDEELERIPVILSPRIKKKTYKMDDKDIAEMILGVFQQKKDDITEEDVLDILRRKASVTDKVLGEFIGGSKPYIVLYYRAIGGNTYEEKLAGLAKTLAHEYMHYMEYRYCSAESATYYENEKLSEAMADFFAALYLLKSMSHRGCYAKNEKRAVLKRRYDAWLDRFGSCWPYAYAFYFYCVHGLHMGFSDDFEDYKKHGCVDKLRKVFGQCYDAERAFESLRY